jgi:hypothetical protein
VAADDEFAALLGGGGGGKKKSKGGGKAKATYLRYDPETGKKARVTRDDDRYDEWLTAAQNRSEVKKGRDTPSQGFLGDVKKEVAKGVGQKIGRTLQGGKRSNAIQKRIAKQGAGLVAKIVKGAAGASGAGKALAGIGLGSTAGLAAALLGTAWATKKVSDAIVEREAKAVAGGKKPTDKDYVKAKANIQNNFAKAKGGY